MGLKFATLYYKRTENYICSLLLISCTAKMYAQVKKFAGFRCNIKTIQRFIVRLNCRHF